MKLVKPAILGAVLASAIGATAYAADPVPTYQANPPQIATNPNLPYSSTRTPGPKVGPSNWIPSPNTEAPAETGGSYYSGKGFGPKPN